MHLKTLVFAIPLSAALGAGLYAKTQESNAKPTNLAAGMQAGSGLTPGLRLKPPVASPEYLAAIENTVQMVRDERALRLAEQSGLRILNLTWEDTGRYKNSAVGPNISDMTIQVFANQRSKSGLTARSMPVIRYDNFTDKTGDIDPQAFSLVVGNQVGGQLRRVSLYDFLQNPTRFMSKPSSWLGANRTLLAPRDSKVLVSAQACFLPVPPRGKATFNPVLFNYQSVSGDPAVLTILATREGTSMTVIDNKRDAFEEGAAWGQRLFHNQSGMRASLTGERESDFQAAATERIPRQAREDEAGGMNMVFLIQVPLKQKHPMRDYYLDAQAPAAKSGQANERIRSEVENAVIGHGALEGPFTEVDNLAIERDPNFPIRVTVQFYKATATGTLSASDMRQIKREIDTVYEQADAVGSLVTEGNTGRVTEYYGMKVQPPDWWQRFWERYTQNTGRSREEAIQYLRRLLGPDYMQRPVAYLYLYDELRQIKR